MARVPHRDAPLKNRADEIAQEARRRVAESGGNPKNLPAMLQKVTQEYRIRDQQNRERGGVNAEDTFQMPNNIENYIDEVLRMSGMTQPNNGGGAQLPQGSNAPIPSNAPISGGDGVDSYGPDASMPPDDASAVPAVNPDEDAVPADADGWTLGQIMATLLGGGAAAATARGLYNMYMADGRGTAGVVDDAQKAIGSMISRVDGTDVPNQTSAGVPAVRDNTMPARSGVDDMIAQTMSDEVINDRIAGAHAAQPQLPSPHVKIGHMPGERERILTEAANMPDPRAAVRYLRQNGIEIGEEEMQMLADKSNTVRGLRERAQSKPRVRVQAPTREAKPRQRVPAASRAVRGAVK